MDELEKDLAIIGAGPGGLSAALYAKRAGLDFVIVEKIVPGGQIINTDLIENYPGFKGDISGYELSQNLVEHCKGLDIKTKDYFDIDHIELVEGNGNNRFYGFRSVSGSGVIKSKTIIVATGASPSRLNVEGEDKLIGRGVSFCATCDGALYKGKEVAVVGGGDTALEEAIFLTKFAKKVYIIHRRDELRAVQVLKDRALKNKRIEFLWSSLIEKFNGDNKLNEVLVRDKKKDKTFGLKVDAVFEYVGWKPNSGLVKDLAELDKNGFIITNFRMETSRPGIFAVGDVRNTPLRQVITAVADGAVAAMYADKFLGNLEKQ
ncbi:MAG: thioredoxin-disulfide reductase [Actinomycetota bacterium]|nr:thioredoxin-disulfide reductase [Actinomycetota bacterium]